MHLGVKPRWRSLPITSNRISWKLNSNFAICFLFFWRPIVYRLLQIGLVGNSYCSIRIGLVNKVVLVYRLLQIGLVGNAFFAANALHFPNSGLPITSNRISWKLLFSVNGKLSLLVYRLLQIGLVGNLSSHDYSPEGVNEWNCGLPITSNRISWKHTQSA